MQQSFKLVFLIISAIKYPVEFVQIDLKIRWLNTMMNSQYHTFGITDGLMEPGKEFTRPFRIIGYGNMMPIYVLFFQFIVTCPPALFITCPVP